MAKTTDISAQHAACMAYIAIPIQTDDATTSVLTVHRTNPTTPLLESGLTLLSIFAALIQQALRLDQLIKEKTQTLAEENKSLRAALTGQKATYGIIGESKILRASDRKLILETLAASRGNETQAALALGFTPRQFQYRMSKLGIE